jgi:hypothetical protein
LITNDALLSRAQWLFPLSFFRQHRYSLTQSVQRQQAAKDWTLNVSSPIALRQMKR